MTRPIEPPRQQPSDACSEFSSTLALLNRLLDVPTVAQSLDEFGSHQRRKVYTCAVTIWMLILQRLGKGLSLSETVTQLLNSGCGLLPDNKRVREGTLSKNTSAYNRARQQLPLDKVLAFSQAVCDYLGRISGPGLGDRRVFIIDGTTITLPPTPELRRSFPPATNQTGETVWPVAMLLVAHELSSGCALLPQVAPMYGPNRSSEAKLSRVIIQGLPKDSVVMADSGFGIFSVAQASQQAGHDYLFRLNLQRFKAYSRHAELLCEDGVSKTFRQTWCPTSKDRKSTPELAKDAVLECYIHQIFLPDGQELYLVTSLDVTAQCASELYRRRYDVEFDIRDLKLTLDTESIRAETTPMVLKELMTSIVAYNLVAQFRRQAAKLAKVEPRKLSFTGVWMTFRHELLLPHADTPQQWLANYTRALITASQRLLPNRKTPRNYPRKAHPRRSKSTKFQKQLQSQNAEQPPPLAPK